MHFQYLAWHLNCIASCLGFSSISQRVVSDFNYFDVRYPLEVNADRATPGR